jgi:AcrR family transcriptional regulator
MGVAVASRRTQLLDAAAVCFARGGFRGTTVADISAEAGCSQGLLYRYFSGKDDLIAALIERDRLRYTDWLRAIGSAPDPLAALRELLAHVLAEIEQPGHAALELEIAAEMTRGQGLADAGRRASADVLAALADVLRAGQATGAFDGRLDPQVTARALLALVDGLTVQHALDPRFLPARHTEAVSRMIENLLEGP